MTTENNNPARYVSKFNSLRIVVKPAYTKEVDGRIVTVSGKDVRFVEGVFETTDADLIAFLSSPKQGLGNTYIKIDDNVESLVEKRAEWTKDLETREAELAAREKALKKKEAKISGSEEGSKTKKTTATKGEPEAGEEADKAY